MLLFDEKFEMRVCLPGLPFVIAFAEQAPALRAGR
jgi:hypothetical protein